MSHNNKNYDGYIFFYFLLWYRNLVWKWSSQCLLYEFLRFSMKKCQNKKLQFLFWASMTSMSDSSRVKIETLSDKLYSTRRETDSINRRTNWRFFAPRKRLIAHKTSCRLKFSGTSGCVLCPAKIILARQVLWWVE